MWSVWHNWGRVTVLFLISVPMAGAFAWVWARLRARRGAPARDAWAEAMMIAGTAPWLGPLFAPSPNPLSNRRVFLVPFIDLVQQIGQGPRFIVIQVFGNLAVFAALGFFMPIRYRIGLVRVAAIAACASAFVEIMQYVADLRRISSIDDVLINTAGAVLAALACRWWSSRNRVLSSGLVLPGEGWWPGPVE